MIIKSIEAKSIISKSNLPICGFSANPYIGCTHACKYCYASFMKRFTNHKEEWGSFLDVKYWDKIKDAKKYYKQTIFIGSATDPYNQYEKEFKRTRALLEELKNSGAKIQMSTKSNLVLRDLDIIKELDDPLVSFSINTLDEDFRSDMDCASTIEERIEAMKVLHENNIRTTCFISPIFPGITDVKKIIEKCAPYADYVWLENLNLRGEFKYKILAYINDKYPHLKELYNDIYNKKQNDYWENLAQDIEEYAKENSLEYVIDEEISRRPIKGKPILINYFYHSQIKQSAKKNNKIQK